MYLRHAVLRFLFEVAWHESVHRRTGLFSPVFVATESRNLSAIGTRIRNSGHEGLRLDSRCLTLVSFPSPSYARASYKDVAFPGWKPIHNFGNRRHA